MIHLPVGGLAVEGTEVVGRGAGGWGVGALGAGPAVGRLVWGPLAGARLHRLWWMSWAGVQMGMDLAVGTQQGTR